MLDFSPTGKSQFNTEYSPEFDYATEKQRDNFAVMKMACELLGMAWNRPSENFAEIADVIQLECSDSQTGFISLARFKEAFNPKSKTPILDITVGAREAFLPMGIYPENGELFIQFEKSKQDDVLVQFIGLGAGFGPGAGLAAELSGVGTGPGAGNRPASDYLEGEGATGGHNDRRRAYLKAVTQLLVNDLWAAGAEAIAINGNRLGVQTSIRTAGSTILIGVNSVQSPYRIEAIGNQATLAKSVSKTTQKQLYDDFKKAGIYPQISKSKSITLDAAVAGDTTHVRKDK